MKQCEFSQ